MISALPQNNATPRCKTRKRKKKTRKRFRKENQRQHQFFHRFELCPSPYFPLKLLGSNTPKNIALMHYASLLISECSLSLSGWASSPLLDVTGKWTELTVPTVPPTLERNRAGNECASLLYFASAKQHKAKQQKKNLYPHVHGARKGASCACVRGLVQQR